MRMDVLFANDRWRKKKKSCCQLKCINKIMGALVLAGKRFIYDMDTPTINGEKIKIINLLC